MKKILLTLLFFIVYSKSFSQNDDFQYVVSAKDGTEVYVLFEKDNYGIKEFWVKMIPPFKNVKNKKGKLIKTGGGYTLEFFKMNCSDKTYSTSDGIKYNQNGDVVQTNYYETFDEKIIPGTVLSGVYKYICETE
jgi:hypothetical protein